MQLAVVLDRVAGELATDQVQVVGAVLGVLDEARLQGLRVPEQLSLVGFDGTDLTEQSVPRLTSVAQPLQEMGWAALRTVLRLAKGETLESNHVELATRLVVRDSTASPVE